jgi:hypothetical protein
MHELFSRYTWKCMWDFMYEVLLESSPQSPREKNVWQVWSSTKSMLDFFRYEGDVHHEFVPRNTTVNSYFYCDVLRRLRENV